MQCTVKARIETTTEGQIRLGKKNLWELGISTPATKLIRVIREDSNTNEAATRNSITGPAALRMTGEKNGGMDKTTKEPFINCPDELNNYVFTSEEDDTKDLRDTKLFKPLIKGWRREVVFRRDTKHCNIYYIAPQPDGCTTPLRKLQIKMRSMNDIAQHLIKHPDEDLKLENFSYEKKPLGILCDLYKMVRNANEKKVISSEEFGYCPIHTDFAWL